MDKAEIDRENTVKIN